jgi:hypothetical protein
MKDPKVVPSTAQERINRNLHGYYTILGYGSQKVRDTLKTKWPKKKFRVSLVSTIKGEPLVEVRY